VPFCRAGLDDPERGRQTDRMRSPEPVRALVRVAAHLPLAAWLLLAAWLSLAAGFAYGCREGPARPGAQAGGADTTAAADARVVPLRGLGLRVEPFESSPVSIEIAAGSPLRLVEARYGWLRLATWDDRTGWAPDTETVDLALWIHYQQALGGAPLSDLRPGYPLGDGRWGVEGPPPSPGVMTAASVWVLGPQTAPASVVDADNLPSPCGGALRFGLLAEAPAGGSATGGEPVLARARLITTAAPAPSLVALEPRIASPEPSQVLAVRGIADSLLAAFGAAREGERPIVGPARFAPAEWLALGDGTLWATLAGEPDREWPNADSWAAAVVVLGDGTDPEVRLVVPPYPAPALPPALRPLTAFSTTGDGRPTLFVVHRLDYRGQRIELYVARERDVRLFYRGYAWGC